MVSPTARAASRPRSPTGRAAFASTARRILAAARAQFFVHGFRGVTMDDLAAELGMSKKTLYAHYPNKTALLEAMLHAKFGELDSELSRITSECASDFRTGLQRLLGAVQRHAEEIHPAFLRDVRREGAGLFDIVEARRQKVIRTHFGRLFESGRREKLIRRDVPNLVVIEILLGAVEAIINPRKLAELHLTPKAAFAAITSVIMSGLLERRGAP